MGRPRCSVVITCFISILTWDIVASKNNDVLVAFFQGGCSKDSLCQHICFDIDNGHICKCHPGYSINKDGVSCTGSSVETANHVENTHLSVKDDNRDQKSVQRNESFSSSFMSSLVEFPSCGEKVCKNFAKCSIQDSRAKCYCPLGYTGKLCDKVGDIKYPKFTGDGFLALPTVTSGYTEFEIFIKFKPSTDSGLLLFISEHPDAKGDFFSLGLINGFVEFRFDCGSGPAVIRSPIQVKIGQWNRVKARRKEKQGWLWLNGHGPVSGLSQGGYSRIKLRTDLYLGGYQRMSSVQHRVNERSGFVGCVQSLVINQLHYNFRKSSLVRTEKTETWSMSNDAKLGDSIGGWNIGDCSENVCDNVVCHNGGSCEVISPDRYVCLCPMGFYGPNCIQADKVEVPEFHGHSLLQYTGLGRNSLSYTEIEMVIKPTTTEGVILYNGYKNNRKGDYLSVLMRQGYVEFQFDLGTGPAIIRSSKPISLNTWHKIKVSRTGLQGVIEVDDQGPIQGLSKGAYTQLTLLQPLFIGGHPDYDIISKYVNLSLSFQGCIQKLIVNGRLIQLVEEALHSYNVEPCSHPCNKGPCWNSGVCVPKMAGYSCTCSVGFTDAHCQKNLTISAAKFTGSGFLSYDREHITIREPGRWFDIQMRVRGRSLDGLLFWISSSFPIREEADFLSVGFQNGSLLFHYNLGCGRALISYNETRLYDGKWHTIKAQRKKQNGTLKIDGRRVSVGRSPGACTTLNINGPVYIGGMPDVSYNTRGMYKTGFVGCVRDVASANYFSMKLTESEGQGISQCQGN